MSEKFKGLNFTLKLELEKLSLKFVKANGQLEFAKKSFKEQSKVVKEQNDKLS